MLLRFLGPQISALGYHSLKCLNGLKCIGTYLPRISWYKICNLQWQLQSSFGCLSCHHSEVNSACISAAAASIVVFCSSSIKILVFLCRDAG